MTAKITEPEALIYAMITASAVDRKISDDELHRIGSIVKELPPFFGYDQDWLVGTSQACGKVLSKSDGLHRVLAIIRDSLSPHLFETAYVLAAEVVASDMHISAEEKRFMELLAEKLGLDPLVCAALDRAAKARHQPA